MQNLEFRRSSASLLHLQAYCSLFEECFPASAAYSAPYLEWQYAHNPAGLVVGYDAWDGDVLAAHYVTIPFEATLAGSKVKALLSLNTATRPQYQGRGLFVRLAEKTFSDAAAEGFSCVVGVANANSTPGFVKRLGFDLVSPLLANVGVGIGLKYDGRSQAVFSRVWNAESLDWRMRSPKVPVRGFQRGGMSKFWARTGKRMIVAVSERAIEQWPAGQPEVGAPLAAQVFVGLLPGATSMTGLSVSLPERLRPSPLNFIYKPLANGCPKLAKGDVMFDFLDFDAF